MMFSTIRALVGWAFQMNEAIPVKSARYGEFSAPAFGGMSPGELKDMAVDILAKIRRLPEAEQAAIAAYFTGDIRAINAAADLLPAGWPTALRRELARGWANGEQLARSQELIGETFMLSQRTAGRRWGEAKRALGIRMQAGLDVLELLLMDYIRHPSYKNMHRNACIAA
ncbi:hypothetical protein [Microvirgula aerodenitrificans]|uniref:hypothetical protein n=1 Tax=Microvirgula aerodenitrificans TaxID=57480 RepID=UPI0028EC0DCB|nr:hypothetical protein [Microvirgula aerodenitrificans]